MMTPTMAAPLMGRSSWPLVRVGVGAIVRTGAGQVFLARRGPLARNEQGLWACPDGAVEIGEQLALALRRNYREAFGMLISPLAQPGAFDHFVADGQQRRVSVAFVALHEGGEPCIREPGKSSDCGWFTLDALPEPLSALTRAHLMAYRRLLPRLDVRVIEEVLARRVQVTLPVPAEEPIALDGKTERDRESKGVLIRCLQKLSQGPRV